MLSDMERRGLVEVKVDPTDKRARIVDFSPQTEALRGLGRKVLSDLEIQLGARIGAARLEALRDSLHADWGPAPIPGAT
jgi:DNA-binding MarR family transcriptional regulator